MSKKLLIIDGFSLMFRAFYALPPTMTWQSTPINAVYGFINLTFNAIEQFKPSHLVICFDRKEPTFRHEQYPEYKAHRPPPPEAFSVQVPILKNAINELGFVTLEKAGYEADDLMGTLSKLAEDQALDTLLLTGDQDSFQLVSKHVVTIMGDRKTGQIITYTPEKVVEKMGIGPELVIDYKSLKGDSSDNIPGVPGVGDKTALQLLSQFGNLDGIYQNLDAVKSDKLRQKLIDNKDQAYLSQMLATIHREVPMDTDFDSLSYNPNWDAIVGCFKKYDFKSLIKRYSHHLDTGNLDEVPDFPFEKSKPKGNYTLIQTQEDLDALLPKLKNAFAVDLETTSTEPQSAQIVGVALCAEAGTSYYVACNAFVESVQQDQTLDLFESDAPETGPSFKMNPFLESLRPLLEDPTIPKYTHNGKYEKSVLFQYGITLRGIAFDTMLAAHLLYPLERVGLKALVSQHLGIDMTSYEDVAGSGKSQVTFDQVPLDQATQYAAADADFTFQLVQEFQPKLKEKGMADIFTDIELPVQNLLSDMEVTGVCVDKSHLASLHKDFNQRLSVLEKDIYDLAGTTFNISSPKQLSDILFNQLQLPPGKKTKTGYSTDSSVLEDLKDKHPIAEKLVTYRMLEKLVGTYVRALPELIHPKTKRIHTSFNQTIAATGRLSSTHPNLQNIPIRTEDGQKIRSAFVPSMPGGQILSVDYSQVELRLMAHLAEDPKMMQAFNNDEDIHSATAAIINGVPLEAVDKDMRYKAKAVNFGIIYGISPFGLSRNINIPRDEAKAIIDNYFAQFAGVKTFMDQTIAFAREHAYVRTEYGRVRPLPDIHDRNRNKAQFAERIAVNTRVQGTAAEIMKIAMLKTQAALDAAGCKSKMIIQVHDELVFDVVPDEVDSLPALVRKAMEGAVTLKVPLKVDAEIGNNWKQVS